LSAPCPLTQWPRMRYLRALSVQRSEHVDDWWRLRKPWPADLWYEDAETEKVIVQHLPPKPVAPTYGSTGQLCLQSPFAEGGLTPRVAG
jgi:hypothetical protein